MLFQHCESLEELILTDNHISDDGAHALAEMLVENSSLRMLLLAGNNIGTKGSVSLGNALKTNTRLEVLALGIVVWYSAYLSV